MIKHKMYDKDWVDLFSFMFSIEGKKDLVEYHLHHLSQLVAPSMMLPSISYDTRYMRKDSMGGYICSDHTIYLDLRYDNDTIIKTLAHEFKHAMQFVENPKRFEDSLFVLSTAASVFNDKEYLEFYFSSQIEIDARIFASKYCLYAKNLMSRETFLAIL